MRFEIWSRWQPLAWRWLAMALRGVEAQWRRAERRESQREHFSSRADRLLELAAGGMGVVDSITGGASTEYERAAWPWSQREPTDPADRANSTALDRSAALSFLIQIRTSRDNVRIARCCHANHRSAKPDQGTLRTSVKRKRIWRTKRSGAAEHRCEARRQDKDVADARGEPARIRRRTDDTIDPRIYSDSWSTWAGVWTAVSTIRARRAADANVSAVMWSMPCARFGCRSCAIRRQFRFPVTSGRRRRSPSRTTVRLDLPGDRSNRI